MKVISAKQIRVISIVNGFLILLGLLCIILGPISSYGLIKIRDIQYPPGDIMKVIKDIDGNYYYSDGFYGRIQKFDKNGYFQTGWFVNAGGGFFDISIGENNQLRVITARNKKEYVFDKSGCLINTLANNNFDYYGFTNSFNLKSIHIPFYFRIINPLNSWLYLFIGAIVGWLIKWYNKKYLN